MLSQTDAPSAFDAAIAGAEGEAAPVASGTWSSRWLVVAVAAIVVPVGVLAVGSTVSWLGRPFPGFLVVDRAVVLPVGLDGWTGRAGGVPFTSTVLSVDGRPVADAGDVYARARAVAVGTTIHYELAKDGERFTRDIPTMIFGGRDFTLVFGMTLAAAIYVIAGGLLQWLRPDVLVSPSLMFLTANASLYGLLMMLTPDPRYSRFTLLPTFLTQAWLGATCVHFGGTFPTERQGLLSKPWLTTAVYAAGAALGAWAYVGIQRSGIPDLHPLYVNDLVVAAGCLAGILVFSSSYWGETATVGRHRMKLLLPGVLVAEGVPCLVFLYAGLSRGGGVPLNFMAAAPMFLLVALAYAIIRTDLFEVDELEKRVFAYVVMTLGVIGPYGMGYVFLGWLAPGAESSLLFNVCFVVLVALFFGRVQHRVEHMVESAFSGVSPDHRSTLAGVGSTLGELLDIDEIIQQLSATLNACFTPRTLAVLLWMDEGALLWRFHERLGRLKHVEGVKAAAIRERLLQRPDRPWRVGEEPAPDDGDRALSEARELSAAVVVPLSRARTICGAFVVGPSRSGSTYTRVQLDLLQTLATQGAIAIHNALRVRARTAELEVSREALERAYYELQGTQAQLLQTEKMASLGQLVAGVAHEINNPVTFIAGNIVPLQRSVRRIRELGTRTGNPQLSSVADEAETIVEIMAQGAERTAAIVRDLRTFSRGGDEVAQPVDVHEGIDITLRLLGPRMANRITVHRSYGQIPPVRIVSGQLNQVIMNLLANACDAIEGTGNIWLATEHDEQVVRIVVRDDGVGIPEDKVTRIFDPFFTTKRPGQGTGLGLAISYEIVARHGGYIRVRSEVGRGTVFEVSLPTVTGPPRG